MGKQDMCRENLLAWTLTGVPLAAVPEGTEERGRKSNLAGIISKTWPGTNKCVF